MSNYFQAGFTDELTKVAITLVELLAAGGALAGGTAGYRASEDHPILGAIGGGLAGAVAGAGVPFLGMAAGRGVAELGTKAYANRLERRIDKIKNMLDQARKQGTLTHDLAANIKRKALQVKADKERLLRVLNYNMPQGLGDIGLMAGGLAAADFTGKTIGRSLNAPTTDEQEERPE